MQHTLFERIGKAETDAVPMLVVQLMAALKRSAPAVRSVLQVGNLTDTPLPRSLRSSALTCATTRSTGPTRSTRPQE